MKLEVGMYIRTDKGLLGKLLSKEKDGSGFILKYEGQYNKKVWSSSGTDSEIIKSSFNLIDLIEVGDFVNGERVGTSRYGLYVGFDEIEEPFMLEDIKIYEVLTHEQYEANCYKVGE